MEYNFKIYIDNIVFNLQKIGGISVYFFELIDRLLTSEFDVRFIEQQSIHGNILRNKLPIQEGMIVPERHISTRLGSYIPIRLKLREKAIVHSSYYRTCYDHNAVNIVTVHDFNYEYYRHGIPKYIHSYIKGKSIRNADGIICISNSTKKDLLSFYKDIDPNKIKVIYHGASDDFFIMDQMYVEDDKHRFNALRNKKYLLFVGGRSFHKNFNICVDTLAELSGYDLVIVGSGLTDDEIRLLKFKIPLRYHVFTNVFTSELNYLYNNAFCFFYPTSYEGFGIPILEAMQAGCPVVSTKFSSIPEVAGNAGLLVDKICPDAFIEKILSLEDAFYRSEVIRAGVEQAVKFSWNKTYNETVDFYCYIFQKKLKASHI